MTSNRKRVLIFGGTGMAGHMVYYHLKSTNKYDLYNTVFRSKLTDDSILCDVRESRMVLNVIKELKPNIIVNCVGALIKESVSNPDNAILLNAWFPHLLSKLAFEVNAQLIHISTDCVFSGKKGSYKYDDFRDADDIYGRSKALGELINDNDITIRTSIIGPELKEKGEGLFNWFLNSKNIVNGYTNVFWSGITTYELANKIEFFIDFYQPGIYQLTNGIKISKHNLLLLINDVFSLNLKVIPHKTKNSDKSIVPNLDKLPFTIPDYSLQLKLLKKQMTICNDLYKKYSVTK